MYNDIQQEWGSLKGLNEKMAEVEKLRSEYQILPIEGKNSGILYALKITPLDKVKVLIFGQDPYPNINNAHGLAFSNKTGKIPASLKNIFTEIKRDIGVDNNCGNLNDWANEGVLLLNTALTFSEKNSLKKRFQFWEEVIDDIINKLIMRNKPLVIMLWGNSANVLKQFPIEKDNEYLEKNILILRSSHPSNMGSANKTPIMEGRVSAFFGCSHFSKCNEFLKNLNVEPINWKIRNEQSSDKISEPKQVQMSIFNV